jgi:AcrR family transcriptional regulator
MEGTSVYKRKNSRADAMTHQPAIEKRKPRADAIRNRERVLEAAKAVFSQGGPEASLEAVARRAGVGIGTLYRHFPTREALYEAVYRHEVEQLVELAKHLEAETAPVEALRRWFAGRRGIHGDKEGHGGGARYGRARFTGPRGLLA